MKQALNKLVTIYSDYLDRIKAEVKRGFKEFAHLLIFYMLGD